jgi:sugar phosphate isomerase/epimerase
VLIDTGHLNLYVKKIGKRADEYIEALPLEIHELHLHDNDGVRHLHLPLHTRQGSILPIMGDAVNGLKRTGFDGIVTLEVIPYGQRVYIKDEGGMASIIRTREIFEDYWSQPTWSHV